MWSNSGRFGQEGRLVGLYAGPFLEGFHLAGAAEFERRVEARRAGDESEKAQALEALARTAGTRGEPQAATAWWRRLAALDPLDARAALGRGHWMPRPGRSSPGPGCRWAAPPT